MFRTKFALSLGASDPTYAVSPAANNVNEGSNLTITVTTENVADGTTLYWTINSNASDFGTSSGSFTINSNTGTITITPTADNTTEGAETFTLSIRTDSVAGTVVATTGNITINDTSLTIPYLGSNYGYRSGGQPSYKNTIDKWPFASSSPASDVGDLTEARARVSGSSSSSHGYTSGGFDGVSPYYNNVIDRFSFSSDGNASDVGDVAASGGDAASHSSTTNGYQTGGFYPGSPYSSTIYSYPFSSSANASNVGSLSLARNHGAGASSTTHGYTAGGRFAPGTSTTIDKFPFASNGTATDVGDLYPQFIGLSRGAGFSSSTHGYMAGGYKTPGTPTHFGSVQKYSFASDANATGAAYNIPNRHSARGNQSTTAGYVFGGEKSPYPPILQDILKISFSNDAVSTYGNLTEQVSMHAGHQY